MILIALGANLPSEAGPPAETLRASLAALAENGIRIVRVSHFFQTPAWPDPVDPPFTNAVALVETTRNPAALLALLHEVESRFGRVRGARNTPRTLDLDLLDYDGRIEAGPPVLPHPRLAERAFVLVPLAEVVPDWRHPATGQGVDALLAAIPLAEREAIRQAGA